MACTQVTNGGEGVKTWKVAANTLNKRSLTVDNGWSLSFGLGVGLASTLTKEYACYEL